jgi:hypothetical protein
MYTNSFGQTVAIPGATLVLIFAAWRITSDWFKRKFRR